MPQVSHWQLPPRVWEQIFELFLKAVAKTKNKKTAGILVGFLLSPTEKIMLAKRVTAALLILKGISYEEIHKAVHLSAATIARLKNRMEENEEYKELLKMFLNDEMFVDNFWKLVNILGRAFSFGRGGNVWRELAKVSNRKLNRRIL